MRKISGVVLLAALFAAVPVFAQADGLNSFSNFGHVGNYFALLSGGQEVPAISTPARGKALIRMAPSVSAVSDGSVLNYSAGWEGLEGDILQAHLHFGARGTNGGVIAFLCSNLNSTPLEVQPCPQRGVISGRIGADQIIGPDGQGIAAGELREVLRAVREGLVYVNVHTSDYPGGEIRGQLQRRFAVIDTHLDPSAIDINEFLGEVRDVESR